MGYRIMAPQMQPTIFESAMKYYLTFDYHYYIYLFFQKRVLRILKYADWSILKSRAALNHLGHV